MYLYHLRGPCCLRCLPAQNWQIPGSVRRSSFFKIHEANEIPLRKTKDKILWIVSCRRRDCFYVGITIRPGRPGIDFGRVPCSVQSQWRGRSVSSRQKISTTAPPSSSRVEKISKFVGDLLRQFPGITPEIRQATGALRGSTAPRAWLLHDIDISRGDLLRNSDRHQATCLSGESSPSETASPIGCNKSRRPLKEHLRHIRPSMMGTE